MEEQQQKELQNLVKPGTPHEEISEMETEKCIDRFDKIRNSNGDIGTAELKVINAKNNAVKMCSF